MRVFLLLVLAASIACGDDAAPADAGADASAMPDLAMEDGGSDAGEADAGFDAGPSTPRERLAFTGPNAVGFASFPVRYDAVDGSGERALELLVWYPAESPSEMRARYSLRRSDLATVDAPVLAGEHPTLVFSHGHRAFPDALSFVMEHFASHGWFVVSPTHTGNTTTDEERDTSIYYHRPEDLRASLDAAIERYGEAAGSPRIVSGHSFGGYTALAAAGATYDTDAIVAGCEDGSLSSPICTDLDPEDVTLFETGFADARYDAVITMAAGDASLFGAGVSNVTIPLFQMVAENDGNPRGESDQDAIWNAADGPDDLRWNLLLADHNSFTDVCTVLPGFLQCSMEDPREEIDYVRVYALAFARARVRGGALRDEAEMFLTAADERIELVTR